MKRRNFLATSVGGIGLIGAGKLVAKPLSLFNENPTNPKVLFKMGILTDLHQDLITDGVDRVQQFITEMNQVKPDFIVQMGDFCVPKPQNQVLMDTWNQFAGPKYHVIGNHDIDGGFTHDDVVKFWNARDKYYSFDYNGYHFTILNGNERPAGDTSKGYPRSISKEQREWLKHDLDATKLPVIVFCHQGIDNDLDGIKEGNLIRVIFERVNKNAGFRKIQLVLSGHNHEDYLNTYNDVHYLQINSMSYQFAHLKGDDYSFALTKDPIWALITVFDNNTIEVKGKQSTYLPGKWMDKLAAYDGYPTVPVISDRIIKV